MREIIVKRLGVQNYQQTWQYQEELFQSIIQNKIKLGSYTGPNFLLCVEHSPVFTIGKSGDIGHLLVPQEFLAEKHIDFFRNNRGGDITFHGWGQMVVYPILDLEHFFTDLKKYMRFLEETVIRTLKDFNINSVRIEGQTGVWVKEKNAFPKKICALGVRTSRWVLMHGLALNVHTDLSYFNYIVPCGIQDKGVTSMKQELNRELSINEVFDRFLIHFAEIFEATYL
ncbi:MAG: lipoyl(octanoyl) transferase LipB [Chitinophagales bacterium]|nr:lipoyl(octanoyl) transferase LipB [Chitinophagales bacterium]MCZ2394297.1 lipoyl(octanoyl) transferase LipB [Chitinophagales bacterium]